MKKALFLLIPSFALFGCTYQAPVLKENQYNQYATAMVVLDKCYHSGYIDAEKTALGKRYLNSTISKFAYNKYTLDRKYNEFKKQYESNYPLSEERANCKNLELAVVQRKQEIDINNKHVEDQRKIINDTLNTIPKTTYCNQIGTQTFCNSY